MRSDINDFADRVRPIGVLYVDVHPFRIAPDGTGEFLLLRRGRHVPLPDQWQTVSGKIAKGERIADAFLRQVRKKTGQSPLRVYKLATVTTFYDEYYDTVMMVPGAAAQLGDGEVGIDPDLHVDHRWVTLPQALELLPWPAQRQAVTAIAELVENGGSSAQCTLLPPSAFTTVLP